MQTFVKFHGILAEIYLFLLQNEQTERSFLYNLRQL